MGMTNIVGSTATDALQQTLTLAEARHNVLADDIANIDTPGFRMKDLDVGAFQSAMGKAISRGRRTNPNSARLDLPSFGTHGSTADGGDLSGIVFHDDNNRGVEELMVALTQNQIKHQRAASVLRNQLALIRSVISGNA